MSFQNLRLNQIRLDGDTQPRVALDESVVDEYCDILKSGGQLPPLAVYFDETHHWLTDGFHRYSAATRAGMSEYPCAVSRGTVGDARWASFAANAKHGLRRSNSDKRRAILKALEHPKSAEMSTRELAKHLAVHFTTVAEYRARLNDVGKLQPDSDGDRNGQFSAEPMSASDLATANPIRSIAAEVNDEEGRPQAEADINLCADDEREANSRQPAAPATPAVPSSVTKIADSVSVGLREPAESVRDAQEALGHLTKRIGVLNSTIGDPARFHASRSLIRQIGENLESWGQRAA